MDPRLLLRMGEVIHEWTPCDLFPGHIPETDVATVAKGQFSGISQMRTTKCRDLVLRCLNIGVNSLPKFLISLANEPSYSGWSKLR